MGPGSGTQPRGAQPHVKLRARGRAARRSVGPAGSRATTMAASRSARARRAQPLHEAAIRGDLTALSGLIRSAQSPKALSKYAPALPDADNPDSDEWFANHERFPEQAFYRTPLYLAAHGGHTDCVNALIAAEKAPPGCTFAARIFRRLVAATPRWDVDIPWRQVARLRYGAVQSGHMEVVDLLIAHGANLNIPDYCGWSPLWISARESKAQGWRPDWMFKLLRAGADIGHLLRERYSGADILVETFSEPLVEYLRAVHAAGGFAAFAEARQCQLKTIKLLARRGARARGARPDHPGLLAEAQTRSHSLKPTGKVASVSKKVSVSK